MTYSLMTTLNRIKSSYKDGTISERTAELLSNPYIKEINKKQKKELGEEYQELNCLDYLNA